jgi:hypothetical protein
VIGHHGTPSWSALARVVMLCAVVVVPVTGSAQTAPRFDVTVGGGVVSGADLGTRDATIRTNSPTLTPFKLFSTSTRRKAAPSLEVRVAGALSPRVSLEGHFSAASPSVDTSVTGDVESAPNTTVSSTMTRIAIGGGLRFRLDDPRRARRLMPHVLGGVGVAREGFDGGGDAERHLLTYLGGGLRYALGGRPRGFARQGVRVDAHLQTVGGGVLRDGTSRQVTVVGGFFFAF